MAGGRYLNVSRPGRCVTCAATIEAGTRAWWDADAKELECGACRPQHSSGGASARRIGEQRFANRDRATRDKHRIVGGLLMATRERPQHEQAWFTGADGERRIADMLDSLAPRNVLAIHDRGVTGSRANIDHIAVAPGGVFVIDTKVRAGKLVHRRKELLGRPELRVGTRNETKVVTGMARQVATVRDAVGFNVPVKPLICFLDARWPFLATSFHIDGVGICSEKVLRRVLTRTGPLSEATIGETYRSILRATRPAS